MQISTLSDDARAAWDHYVRSHPCGLPQQLSAWQEVLRASYGHHTHYLLARDSERVVGIMPLFFIRSGLFGTRATTMPGALCADDATVAAALIAAAQQAAREAGSAGVTLHDSRSHWTGASLSTSSRHHARRIPLARDEAALWAQLQGNVRRQIRIAQRHGLRTEMDRTGQHIDLVYGLLSQFAHAVGTPTFGREFLERVQAAFPHHSSIVTVWRGQQPIAGYVQLELGETVYGMWGAAQREHLELRPVYLAYWEIMRDATARGFRALDMGRSPNGSGAAQNKAQWGGELIPIYQQLASADAARRTIPITEQVEHNPAMRVVRSLWPHLPFPVAQFLGPRLRRHVPFA